MQQLTITIITIIMMMIIIIIMMMMMIILTVTTTMIININVAAKYDCSSCNQAYVVCAWDCLIPECIILDALADMACMMQAGKAIGMQQQMHYTTGQVTCGRTELFNLKQYIPQDVLQSLRGVCRQAMRQG